MSRKKSLISHNFARSSQQKVYKQPLTQQIETNWFFLPRMTDNNDNASITEKSIKIFIRIFPFERFCESCAKIDMNRKKIFIRYLQEMQPNRIAIPKKPSYWCFKRMKFFITVHKKKCTALRARILYQSKEKKYIFPPLIDAVRNFVLKKEKQGFEWYGIMDTDNGNVNMILI